MAKANAETFSKSGDQYMGREYKPNDFDCQDFVEHMMQNVGINENLPGSNAWYRKMTWVGTPEDCIKKFGSIPKGALLYILKQDGKEPEKYKADGIGNASHIGVKTGRTAEEMMGKVLSGMEGAENRKAFREKCSHGDGAIHSSASRGCVCTSTFKDKTINGGWNRIGLWDRFDYGEKINNILAGKKDKAKEVTVMMESATVFGGNLNLRAMPTTTAERMTQIPSGAQVTVIEKTNEDWWKVTYQGYTGYVMQKYLTTEEVASVQSEILLPYDVANTMYEALKAALHK